MISIRFFFLLPSSHYKAGHSNRDIFSTLHWKSLSVVSSAFICRQWLFFWIYRAYFWTLYDTGKLLLLLLLFYYCYYQYYYYYYYHYYHLVYRHECFTGKCTTRKIHKNYIRDLSGLFSIISHVSLSMT